LQPLDQFRLESRATSCGAKRSVAPRASGAAGDLREFGGIEAAMLVAIELAVGGKGDMVNIEIEAHADGVGGDEKIDIAVLIELDLGVACARRKRAKDDGGAAALTADQFGDRVYFLGGKGDDRRAARQAREFLVAGENELRKARALDDIGARQELFDQRAE